MQFAATAVMKPTILITATAVALAGLAGCDRKPEQRAAGGASAAQSNTPSTPANVGTPSASERSPAVQPPVQGREDVRQPEQRKDFEQKGDSAGPKPGG
jgi:hypothetical protein